MLSILIPSKEEPNILKMLADIDAHFPTAQVIVANDRYGKGKGWAVREALKEATGEYVVFIDGDGDIEAKMIWRLLAVIENYEIVVGKKKITGLWSRRIITFLSRIYIRLLFGVKVDTQTGIKMFRRHLIPEWRCNSFAFDIEILNKCKHRRIVEVPIEANIRKKTNLKAVWACFVESVKLLL